MFYTRIAVLLLAVGGSLSATTLFKSDFEDGTTQGWTVFTPDAGIPGGTGPFNIASGGVGNSRYLQTEDTADGRLFFVAPVSWAGNLLGLVLQFELRNQNPNTYANIGYFGDPVLRVTGSGPTLYYYHAPGANLNWTLNTLELGPGPNWSLNPYSFGSAAPAADVNATLANVTGIFITADWVSGWYGKPNSPNYGHDITGLDNVAVNAIPEPATFLLIGVPLACLFVLRARKR